MHSIDTILIFRSLTKLKTPIDIPKDHPARILTKAGGTLPVGLNFEDFKEALLRIAIKGKKIFNVFAEKLKNAEISNRSAVSHL
jgi:hypothetical protein